MPLTKQLKQRLRYAEMGDHIGQWAKKSTVNYNSVKTFYAVKLVLIFSFLLVDLGFNSSLDHDEPLVQRQRDTMAMILFGAQVSCASPPYPSSSIITQLTLM